MSERATVGSGDPSIETVHVKQASTGMVARADGRLDHCTAKWYRDAPLSYEDEGLYVALGDRSLLHNDIKIAERANHIIADFNAMRFVAETLRLATTQVMSVASGPRAGQHVLVESGVPRDVTRINSNSGWSLRAARKAAGKPEIPWTDAAHATSAGAEQRLASVVDALCHFSYHQSSGKLLLCNASACWDAARTTITLCDVVLHSRGCTYGPTDLGPTGIANFFGHNQLSDCCRREWRRPPDAEVLLDAQPDTIVHRPTSLPSRIIPPEMPRAVRPLVAGGRRGQEAPSDWDRSTFFVDQTEQIEEAMAWGREAHLAKAQVAGAVAWKARATRHAEDAARAREVAHAAADAARREAYRGINGIDGCIGRQPTTQQPRPTVTEVLYHGSWKDIPPLAELMQAPNDGTFFQEPAEEEGEEEDGA